MPDPDPDAHAHPDPDPNGSADAHANGGEVEAATGQPTVTPPPTDALPTGGTPNGSSLAIALLAIGGLLATILLLAPATPAKARRRR